MTGLEALENIKHGIYYDGEAYSLIKDAFDVSLNTIEKELKQLQELYNKIKQIRDDARLERYEHLRKQDISDEEKSELCGEICAYSDILKLMENMFEVLKMIEEGK